MIALALCSRVFAEPNPLLRLIVRGTLAPMLIGWWLAEFASWLGEPYSYMFLGGVLVGSLAAALRLLWLYRRR